MAVYYNEIEPAAAHVLRELIKRNVVAPGEVDTRSIKDVQPDDLRGFTQCHFFAGGGLWSVAARLAGWPDDRPLWTGSCPCQPFSVAGKGAGTSDPRHLWPDFFRLIGSCRPPVVVGEQVAGSAGYGWFDGVSADLEGEGYASRAVDIPACAVDAPHIRQRLYWVAMADASSAGTGWNVGDAQRPASTGEISGREHWGDIAGGIVARCAGVGHSESLGRRGRQDDEDGRGRERAPADTGAGVLAYASRDGQFRGAQCDSLEIEPGQQASQRHDHDGRRLDARGSFWSDAELRLGADGKARRVKPGVRLLVDGLPGRVGLLRIGGNAIVPQVAAEVLGALLDEDDRPDVFA